MIFSEAFVAFLLAAGLSQAPARVPLDGPGRGAGYAVAAPVELVAQVAETVSSAALAELAQVRGLEVVVLLDGNMLSDAAVATLRRLPRASVRVRPPLEAVHVDQLGRLGEVGVVVDLGAATLDDVTRRRLEQLGPRRLTIALDASRGIDAARIDALRRMKHARIELDFGRRRPGPEELRLIASLPRARATVLLDAGAPVEAIRDVSGAGLAVSVHADDDRLPPELLAELRHARVPVSVALSGTVSPSDVARLGGVSRLARLLLRFEKLPQLPGGTAARLSSLRPPPL